MSVMLLETERLSLREITADDLDDLLEIWGDPEAMRHFPGALDRQAMREWIERKWPSGMDCESRRRFSGVAISIMYMLSN